MGVAAGVMALIIALSINNGFRNAFQRTLLGATAHVSVLEKNPQYGIGEWKELSEELRSIPRVAGVMPTLYAEVFFTGPGAHAEGGVLKGVRLEDTGQVDVLTRLKEGSLERLAAQESLGMPGIVLGSRLAQTTGMRLDAVLTVISPQGELTPFGRKPSYHRFRVVGIFESGFYELDARLAFTTLRAAQRVSAVPDVVNAIELRLDDINRAGEVAAAADKIAGPQLQASPWMEQNRQMLSALKMERVVTVVTIGLIELVAALNILITLVMMVMEKHRDIAILMSLGARREQIRGIFMLQGVIIGVVGSALGLAAGYGLSFLADKYRWIQIDADVYSLSYVPFDPRWIDALWVPAAAIVVSFLATIYPARNATRIAPAEALRYE
ncbi:MAG: ABC transporter permease [Bryobacteraceae bacterium]|nr:ABC transporter permease [Bryobacteraceae bacterium]